MTTASNDPADDFQYPIAADEDPSEATFLAVGQATDHDPLDLPPLGRRIDTDSLDDLVRGSPDAQGLILTFDYAGCTVTVTHSEVRVDVH
jgi:hypothetical protein